MWAGYNGHVFTVSQLTDFYKEAIEDKKVDICEDVNSGVYYYNIPASFDIEVSSFKLREDSDEPIKASHMYIWQFGLNGSVIYGRKWEEFDKVICFVHEKLNLDYKLRLLIYVHNLGYEFQFIRKYFEWDKVFAMKSRRPIYAITGGLEFRCSYYLSNYSLAYIGDHLLMRYPVKKLVGNLDYNKVRNSVSQLTPAELDYCLNDVRVVMSYIQEKIEVEGNIANIPLTNTGNVRNYCKYCCFPNDKSAANHYRAIMKGLTLNGEDEYAELQRAFMGGFTHASPIWANNMISDIGSMDLASSYPAVIVMKYFPMSKGIYIGDVKSQKVLEYYLKTFCCLFDVKFKGLVAKVDHENILSESRCWCVENKLVCNGRIVSADSLCTTITELDFDSITKFYDWDEMAVQNLWIYNRGYLPTAFVKSVLDLYETKTKLKGVEGKEVEYMVSKNMINSCYGMMVTDIVRDEYVYEFDKWYISKADPVSQLTRYNNKFDRFLFYPWGVWVTAHARHNLFEAILEFGYDYVYSDTDSIKACNFEKHLDFVESYNAKILDQCIRAANFHGLSPEKFMPKDRKGVSHLIGKWEIEEGYAAFKTCGAKRYMYVQHDGMINMTVAGVNKNFAMPYLLYTYGGGSNYEAEASEFCETQGIKMGLQTGIRGKCINSWFITVARKAYQGYKPAVEWILEKDLDYFRIFHEFKDGMYIPAGHTGKQTLTYIDGAIRGICTDYRGIPETFYEESGIHMEGQSYLMSQLSDFIKYIGGVQLEQF